MTKLSHEAPVLHPQRLIETELVAQVVDVGLAGARLEQEARRVAGHPDEQEDGERQQE